ncbi:MAG: hypothetical protein DMG79_14750 [Acidobacteria bacterium]|nr:MAG: hypothetical protein DMG79_14750 [Acidobacteriota bacterium]
MVVQERAMGRNRRSVYAGRYLRMPQRLRLGLMGSKLRAYLITITMFLMICTSAPLIGQGGEGKGNESGTASAIRALEREWVEGQSRNNNRALDLIFDNALVYVEYGKLISKGEYLSRIKWAAPSEGQIAMEPMTVRLFGSTAIVIGTYSEKLAKGGTPAVRHWRFVDTWVYKKGGWVLVAAAAAPIPQ